MPSVMTTRLVGSKVKTQVFISPFVDQSSNMYGRDSNLRCFPVDDVGYLVAFEISEV